MKKGTIKLMNKTAKKIIKQKIRSSLVTALEKTAGEFGARLEKLEKVIKKNSKKLAKKILKEIKPAETKPVQADTPVFNEASKKAVVNPVSKTPVNKQAVKIAAPKEPAIKKDSKPVTVK